MLDYLPSMSEDRGSIPSSKTSKKKMEEEDKKEKGDGGGGRDGGRGGGKERNLFPTMLLFSPRFLGDFIFI